MVCVATHPQMSYFSRFRARPQVNPLYMGCHSDTGYVHQARGFSSQLLFGESFEAAPGEAHTWQATIHASTANATVELLTGDGLHGQTALHVQYRSGHGLAALANRGLHNEGLFLQKGKTYEGFLWVKSARAGSVAVSLFDYTQASPPPAPSGNVYAKVSHGKACEEASRIPLPCGSCGPHWGDVNKCESTCNQLDDCRFITFFEDLGCRVYSACDAPYPYGSVGTDM